MKRILALLLAAAAFLPALARADSTVISLPPAPSLIGGSTYLNLSGVGNNQLLFNTALFGVSAGGFLTLNLGSVSSTYLSPLLTPGSCTNCNLNYDGAGRILVAANGSSGGSISITGGDASIIASPSPITGAGTITVGGPSHLTAFTAGTLPMGAGSSPFTASEITDVGLVGVLIGSPTGGQKGAGTINMTGCFINNVACATSGGGGVTWPATHDVVISNGSSSPAGAAPSTSGFVLTSNGGAADPTFQAAAGGGNATTATGISAAGTVQGTATVLTTDWSEVSTVGAGQGVLQETPVNGKSQVVANNGANTLLVYPVSGGMFDQLGSNVAISVAAGARVILYCFSTVHCDSK